MNRAVSTAVISASLLAAAALIAGPLDPPAGPVASTYKTLSEVEPRIPVGPATTPGDANSVYRISQPGSYYLTGDIVGIPSGWAGVEIEASGVTLDLSGFSIRGQGTGSYGVLGIPGTSNITVRNGTVQGLSGTGISMVTSTAARVEAVRAIGNGTEGIRLDQGGHAVDCLAEGNAGAGINILRGTLDRCTARQNGQTLGGTAGISATYSVVRGCAADFNGYVGFRLNRCTTVACTASNQDNDNGFELISGTIEGCHAYSNGGHGFELTLGAVARGCTSSTNSLHGYHIGGSAGDVGAAVFECSATGNAGSGFNASDAQIESCRAVSNSGDGIRASSACTIQGCLLTGNGAGAAVGSGILLTGASNRVEGNQCIANDTGVNATGADNFIARNTCRGNSTNFSIAAGNESAPVITNPGSNAFATMTPWSNVAY